MSSFLIFALHLQKPHYMHTSIYSYIHNQIKSQFCCQRRLHVTEKTKPLQLHRHHNYLLFRFNTTGTIKKVDERMEKTNGKEGGVERGCLKVSAQTKGPVMMCSKSSDRFPEYVLLSINSHYAAALRRTNTRLQTVAFHHSSFCSSSIQKAKTRVRLIISESGGSKRLCFVLNFHSSHSFIVSSRFRKLNP